MTTADDVLVHYGRKGMKWGVRNIGRQDKKWQNNIYSIRGAMMVHNASADIANNGGIAKLNRDWKGKGVNLDKPDHPATKAYLKDYERRNGDWVAQAVKNVHGKSPSGKYEAHFDRSTPEWKVVVRPVKVSHADIDVETQEFVFELNRNSQEITSVRMIKDDLMQMEAIIEEALVHYGKKGMKWGVRKAPSQKLGKSKDSKNIETALKKSKSSGVRSLSNKELSSINTRLEMEKKFSQLSPSKRDKGKKFASTHLGTPIKVAVAGAVTQQVGKAIAKQLAVATAKKTVHYVVAP